jgi:hypothetical protein
MKTVTAYQAADGTMFDNMKVCEAYEREQSLHEIINAYVGYDSYTDFEFIARLIKVCWPQLVELLGDNKNPGPDFAYFVGPFDSDGCYVNDGNGSEILRTCTSFRARQLADMLNYAAH